jgi:hypothetical protein
VSYPLRLEYLKKEGRNKQTNKLRERKKERIPPTVIFKQMRLLYTNA